MGYTQPAVITSASSREINKVIKQAYLLVGISLIPCIIGAFVGIQIIGLILSLYLKNKMMFFVGEFAIFYGFCFAIEKNRDNAIGILLMLIFTFLLGLLLAPLLSFALGKSNGLGLIASSAGGTGLLFLLYSFIGSNTEKDYSSWSKYIFITVLVTIATVVLNMFFLQLPFLSIIISAVIIPLSGFMVIYRINDAARGGETSYISLALSIFIGIYNTFSALLRLLISFSGND